jgi:hypothetical protein
MADIFFSYTKADRNRVEPLIAALQAKDWTVWWDTDIHGGDSWDDVIEAQLTKARCVVVAWSRLSAKSDWVKEEARVANRARKLVPVLLDSMDPPFGFGGVQAVDFSAWTKNNDAPEFLKLCASVRDKLGSLSSSQLAPESSTQIRKSITPPARPRRWLIPTIVVTVVCVGFGVAGLILYSRPEKAFIINVQVTLCVPDANGVADESTITAVRSYLQGKSQSIPVNVDPTSPELRPLLQAAIDDVGSCRGAGFKNAYEVGFFGVPAANSKRRIAQFQAAIDESLEAMKSSVKVQPTGKLDEQTRAAIGEIRRMTGTSGDEVDSQLVKRVLPFL